MSGRLKQTLGCVLIASVATVLVGRFVYAHPFGLFLALGGGRVAMDRGVYGLGRVGAGATATFPAIVRNVCLSRVKILGVDAPCGCITVEPMPLELGVGAEAAVIVHCQLPWSAGEGGRFAAPIAYFVEDGNSVAVARVEGTIASMKDDRDLEKTKDVMDVRDEELKPVPTS